MSAGANECPLLSGYLPFLWPEKSVAHCGHGREHPVRCLQKRISPPCLYISGTSCFFTFVAHRQCVMIWFFEAVLYGAGKQDWLWCFVKHADAGDLPDFIKRWFTVEVLFGNRNQNINTNSSPDLWLHCIFRTAPDGFHPEVRPDPLQHALYFPAVLAALCPIGCF